MNKLLWACGAVASVCVTLSACSSDDDTASGGAGAAGKAGETSAGGGSTVGAEGGSGGEAGSPVLENMGGAPSTAEGGAAGALVGEGGSISGVGTRACIRAGTIDVSALSSLQYVIDNQTDPDLTLCRGSAYAFVLDQSTVGHPFYIKTVDNSTGTGNAYASGVTGNGYTNKTLIFDVPADAPDTLYYHCSNHAGMGGKIIIVDSNG